ncbi:MAG: hypothetical protein AB2551_01880 [Candidatus Thiodiazotropha sp.]
MSNQQFPLPRRLEDGSLDLAFYRDQALELRSAAFLSLLAKLGHLLRMRFGVDG